MKHGVTIREYKNQDGDQILALLKLNTPKYFAPEEKKDLVYYLENELEHYFVIEVDQSIVGSGGFNFSGGLSIAKISWDILHPDFQGQSLGSLLLNYRVEKLRKYKDLKKIIVRTSQFAYKFYEKNGFQLQKVVKDYWAQGFDLYLMGYASSLSFQSEGEISKS